MWLGSPYPLSVGNISEGESEYQQKPEPFLKGKYNMSEESSSGPQFNEQIFFTKLHIVAMQDAQSMQSFQSHHKTNDTNVNSSKEKKICV